MTGQHHKHHCPAYRPKSVFPETRRSRGRHGNREAVIANDRCRLARVQHKRLLCHSKVVVDIVIITALHSFTRTLGTSWRWWSSSSSSSSLLLLQIWLGDHSDRVFLTSGRQGLGVASSRSRQKGPYGPSVDGCEPRPGPVVRHQAAKEDSRLDVQARLVPPCNRGTRR